jgi:hypothetical protein
MEESSKAQKSQILSDWRSRFSPDELRLLVVQLDSLVELAQQEGSRNQDVLQMNVLANYVDHKLEWVCLNCHFHHFVEPPDFINSAQGGRLLVCTNCYHYFRVRVAFVDYVGSLTLHAPDVANCPACGEALECSTSKCRYYGQVPPRG